jgi:hypothetical protein
LPATKHSASGPAVTAVEARATIRHGGMGIENERGRMLIASSISRCELLIVGADLVFAR